MDKNIPDEDRDKLRVTKKMQDTKTDDDLGLFPV